MLNIQRHRGPDGEGLWFSKEREIGLCHSRLAILDLSDNGAQPMCSTDGRYVIVFNGEIYNEQDLRENLKKLGASFRGHSDTEVLLEAYRYWGAAMLQKLRGMFAFAIYDEIKHSLFCARDRVGKKPFVYAQTSTAFVFASEIPAIKQIPNIDISHNHAAIAAMLLHNMRHIPDPYTAYVGVNRLRAGHAMIVKEGKIERIWCYWLPTPIDKNDATPERLREVIEQSVCLRMHADVPVGALLSGGVDSSSIVALMQKQSKSPVHTYALGMDSADEDLSRARLMANKLGTIHKEFYFEPDAQWEIMGKLLSVYGEPIMLMTLLHAYTLFRAIQDDGIKVVMTGNGADELFYGYTGHPRTLRVSRLLEKLGHARFLFRPLEKSQWGWISAKPGTIKAAWYQGLSKKEWRCLSREARHVLVNRVAEEAKYWGVKSPSLCFIDESNFVGLMLENTHSVTTAGDLPAMMASVETRAPFLDQEIISFALGCPAEKKIPTMDPNWLKAILREAVRDLLPDSLLTASKRGFGHGIQEAGVLRGAWREKAESFLLDIDDCGGLFDRDAVRTEWHDFLAGKRPAAMSAKLLAIQRWLRE
jgi:asparagine synthase (glutamine-hydrolysing)